MVTQKNPSAGPKYRRSGIPTYLPCGTTDKMRPIGNGPRRYGYEQT